MESLSLTTLQLLDHLPEGLLDCDARHLHGLLGGPTLIHLGGRRQPTLFVSVLLHGNETTGWEAMRRLLKRYRPGGGEQDLPRDLTLLIGNTAAAAQGMRRLDGQPDYNRVWPGSEEPDSPERRMMQQVVDHLEAQGVFASVDVHNNTGKNPHYACINRIDQQGLHLATLFSRIVIYFLRPSGVQSMAMTRLCPAVTLECGKVGEQHSVDHALEYLDACLHLSEHPQHPLAPQDVDLFHTVAVVKVPEEVEFSFNGDACDLRFIDDLDRLNFRELAEGVVLAELGTEGGIPLIARSEDDEDVTARYFRREDDQLVTNTRFMPSMLTCDARVIRQDCLCYIMERYALPASASD